MDADFILRSIALLGLGLVIMRAAGEVIVIVIFVIMDE